MENSFINKITICSIIGGVFLPFLAFGYSADFYDNFDEYGSATSLSASSKWTAYTGQNLSSTALYTSPIIGPSGRSVASASSSEKIICPNVSPSNKFTLQFNLYRKGTTFAQYLFQLDEISSCSANSGNKLLGVNITLSSSSPNIGLSYGGGGSVSLAIPSYSYNTWTEDIQVKKEPGRAKVCYGSQCSSWLTFSDFSVGSIKLSSSGIGSSNLYGTYLDSVIIVDESSVDAVCGTANGEILEEKPVLLEELCSQGTLFDEVLFDPLNGWFWTCNGENGGASASCSASFGQNSISGSCGLDNGMIFSTGTPGSALCGTGSFSGPLVTTPTGWTWTCTGYNGGSLVNCSAELDPTFVIDFPDAPEQENCSSFTGIDKSICDIRNFIAGLFLPSSEKMNELNIVLNTLAHKAPFIYISTLQNKIAGASSNIHTEKFDVTVMGHTAEVNIDILEPIANVTKLVSYVLLVLLFVVWARGFIKQFF